MIEDAAFTLRDEVAEVLRCLRESLRQPAFATALALVLFGKRQGEGDDLRSTLDPSR